jgi:hypothetical protein
MELDLPEETSPDAEEGRLLHAACATEDLDALEGEQQDTAERALRLRDEALEAVFGSAVPDDCEFAMEQPLTFATRKLGNLFQGTADFTAIGSERALVADYKFGRLPVNPAADNLQLAAYASMLTHSEHFAGTVFVALIRPRAPREEALTLAEYDEEEVARATQTIGEIFETSNRLDAPLTPSEDACRYCRARAICPALNASVTALTTTRRETIATLPADKLGATMDAIRFAAQIKSDVQGELVRRIDEGFMPGWKLRGNGSISEVGDTRAAFAAFRENFGTHHRYQGEGAPTPQDDFMRCVSVSVPPLVELVQELAGCSATKARRLVEGILGANLVRTSKAPSPVRS